jgi:hypothetical protein
MENIPTKSLGHMTFNNEIIFSLFKNIHIIKNIPKYFTLQTY